MVKRAKQITNTESIVKDETEGYKVVILAMTVVSCCWIQGASLESILSFDSNGGAFLTSLQFLTISIMSFPTSRNVIPMSYHIGLSLLYFLSSRMNSLAFSCGISFPLLNLFRASTPMASLLSGYLFFQKKYDLNQILGVGLISCGICISSWMDNPATKFASFCVNDNNGYICRQPIVQSTIQLFGLWKIGISLLSCGLLLGSILGHVQNRVMRAYSSPNKNHPAEESMFYLHMISLGFMALGDGKDVSSTFSVWRSSPLMFGEIPSIYIYVLINLTTNYICIRSVYYLAAIVSTVSLQVILTFRKACSLVFSVIYFSQAFSLEQWIGTCVLFSGVLVYSKVLSMNRVS